MPKEYFERARTLRQEMTPAERRLWSALRGKQLGVKFRKQHPIGPYIVDFYSWEAGLVIEVDGESHFTPEAQEYDSERAAYLNSLGLTVLRFTNPEVNHHTEGVLESIAGALQWIEPSEDHYQQWRRADSLQLGDRVYFGPEQRLVEITHLLYEETNEEVYDIEVEGAHSFLTEVCAVHNCGSGTTAYVAEQWSRRWITADVSRVAVAITRQRLLTAKFDYYALRPTSAEDVQRNPDGPWLTDPEGRMQGTCTFDCKTVPHITLKSIAQNQALDPIFEKWAPILAEKLEVLNRALAETGTRELRQKLLFKKQRKIKADGKRSVTDADERRWNLPETEWREWEVPFDVDPDWPEPLQQALLEYRGAWRQKMDEVNACIAARADQEELVDQPSVDRGKVRVSGPFTVEGVIPAEESIDLEPEETPIGGAPEELETFDRGEGAIKIAQSTRRQSSGSLQ